MFFEKLLSFNHNVANPMLKLPCLAFFIFSLHTVFNSMLIVQFESILNPWPIPVCSDKNKFFMGLINSIIWILWSGGVIMFSIQFCKHIAFHCWKSEIKKRKIHIFWIIPNFASILARYLLFHKITKVPFHRSHLVKKLGSYHVYTHMNLDSKSWKLFLFTHLTSYPVRGKIKQK